MMTRRRLLKLSAASILAPTIAGGTARAETWPDRPIHLVVPIAAGGPTDTNARILADQLSKIWGQQVVVDNKSGAGTNIGNAFVAHSEPDGYTILYGTSSLSANAALYRALDYNPMTDLAPVSLVAKFPFFMFVPNSSPAKTLAEFVALAKEKPGKLIMGSPGTGSGPHLAELLFMQMAQIQMTHAPYRGAAPAFIDLIPGRIDCYFGSGELLTYSRSGQVRALGSSGTKRSPAEPTVPTIAEAGVSGYEVESWQSVFAPAKTPVAIVQKMNAGVAKALADPALIKKLAETAYTTTPSSPEDLGKFLQADAQKWAAIIKAADLKIN
jgi:tripartite-type tricarboxylate transporter receptor subunit TctC